MSVSVIVPAYNTGAHLAGALRSALQQSRPPTEIIVVNDGSTDDTTAVAASFAPQVRLVRQTNAGPASARNHGARLASGEWLAFLDADDEWLSWRLEVQFAQAERHPDVIMWCGQTTSLESEVRSQKSEVQTRKLSLADFAVCNPVATTTVLLRREAFERAGGFDERFRGPEDYELWMRIAAQGAIGLIEWPLARYRVEPGSLSMDDRRFLPQVLAVLDKAYAVTGVLHGLGNQKQALATQYSSASWMAFVHGRRGQALTLLLHSFTIWPKPLRLPSKAKWHRARLAVRYLIGSRCSEVLSSVVSHK